MFNLLDVIVSPFEILEGNGLYVFFKSFGVYLPLFIIGVLCLIAVIIVFVSIECKKKKNKNKNEKDNLNDGDEVK